jgi:hypothetical protein
MVMVGKVYKSEGKVDLNNLPWYVVVKVFLSHMIDNSAILSGNMGKLLALKDEANRKAIEEYTKCIQFHLENGAYKHEVSVPFTFPMEDKELVELAVGGPQFFGYSKEFVQINKDLAELGAIREGVVLMGRLEK